MGANDYFLLADHDAQEFNVIGPVWTVEQDNRWTDCVMRARAKGRQLNCHIFPATNLQQQIREYEQAQNLKYTKKPILPEIDAPPK